MANPILLVKDAGFGETIVPSDAHFQPGEKIIAGLSHENDREVEVVCIGVAPVGVPIEYAIADQSEPKQPRPLALTRRKEHDETIYALLLPGDSADNPRIYTHSQLSLGKQKAEQFNERLNT